MSNRGRYFKSGKGFTLIELLVVVAIIAVLISILLPALSRVRFQAKVVKCLANMQQISVGFFAYTVDNNRLPTKFFAGQTPNDTRRKWETIASISTWEVATLVNENDPSQGLRWNHGNNCDWLVNRFLRYFCSIPGPPDVPGGTSAKYIGDPRVFYCPADERCVYPSSWNGTAGSNGTFNPGWSYNQHLAFLGPQGNKNYWWYEHPFSSGTYPLFSDPVYYLISTLEPRPDINHHDDPVRPPENVIYTDGHAETLYPGNRDYYRLDVWW